MTKQVYAFTQGHLVLAMSMCGVIGNDESLVKNCRKCRSWCSLHGRAEMNIAESKILIIIHLKVWYRTIGPRDKNIIQHSRIQERHKQQNHDRDYLFNSLHYNRTRTLICTTHHSKNNNKNNQPWMPTHPMSPCSGGPKYSGRANTSGGTNRPRWRRT